MSVRTLPGGVVPIGGPVAALVTSLPNFNALRIAARGTPEYWQLHALYRLGLENSVPPAGTRHVHVPSSVPNWLTTTQAAALLGVGERAVTKRLNQGQLEGEKCGGRWRVDRQAIELQLTERHG